MTNEQNTIKVGSMTINAPIRKMPWPGDTYWLVSERGIVVKSYWPDRHGSIDRPIFEAGLCWASEADAQAYADATLILRKGGTP